MNDVPKKSNIALIEKISYLLVLGTAFLMPIFYLPTTTEFFQFNKLTLLVAVTVLLMIFWGLRIVLGQSLKIVKSPLDFTIMALVTVVVLSSMFSIDKNTSIFGVQGRWFPSMFGVLTMVAYYYLSASNLINKQTIKSALASFVAGITLSSVVSLLSYFKIYIGSQPYMRSVAFSLAGSVNNAVFLAAIGTVLSILLYVYEDQRSKSLFFGVTGATNLFLVTLVSIPQGWIPLAAGIVGTLLYADIKKLTERKSQSMALAGILAAILLITTLPTTSGILKAQDFPREVYLPLNESWIVATSTIQSYPLLATGPSTFHLNFTRFRPLSMNNTDSWNVRFDKPSNEILNVLGTIGIVGLVVVLYAMGRVLKLVNLSRRMSDESGLLAIVSIATLSALSVYFVTYATVINTFTLVFMISLLVAVHALPELRSVDIEMLTLNLASIASVSSITDAGAIKKEYFHFVIAIPMFVVAGLGGYVFSKLYTGEYYMRQAIIALRNNNGTKTYEYQGKAINVNPERDTYHVAYAQTNLALANAVAARQNLTDQERSTIQQLISQSIRSSSVATEVVNPLNVANWETRALIYRSLVGVADNAADWALSAYNTAVQLDPTNPALRLDLGGIYYAAGDYLSSANLFRQATALKPDYANAHYNFAQSLKNLGDLNNAKRELELTKNLVAVNTVDYQKVEEELAVINQQLANVAGAATTNKPTVEEIEGAQAETPQEPLTNVGEEAEVIENENLEEALPGQPTDQESQKQTEQPNPTEQPAEQP